MKIIDFHDIWAWKSAMKSLWRITCDFEIEWDWMKLNEIKIYFRKKIARKWWKSMKNDYFSWYFSWNEAKRCDKIWKMIENSHIFIFLILLTYPLRFSRAISSKSSDLMILQDSWVYTHDNLENEIMQNQWKSMIFMIFELENQQERAFGVSLAILKSKMRLNFD